MRRVSGLVKPGARAGLGLILAGLLPPAYTVAAGPALPPLPQTIWSAWSWEPWVLLGLALSAWAYGWGLRRLWQQAGPGRVIRTWQVAGFATGLAAVFVALVSPLSALAEALFSAHMVQHLLLTLLAAPLLVLGAPLVPFLWALPVPARRAVGRWWRRSDWARRLWHIASQPYLVWFLYALSFWIWHLPSLYQAALERVWVHQLEHISFIVPALLFWWTVIHPLGGHRRLGYGAGALYLFTTALHSSALGALLTFARQPLYPIYLSSVAAWDLTLLEDQQLAGVIMWVPAGIIYPVSALLLLGIWLQRMENRLNQGERERAAAGPALAKPQHYER